MSLWPFGKKRGIDVDAVEQAPVPAMAEQEAGGVRASFDSWGGLSYETWESVLGGVMASGQVVNADTAMRCSAVFACVRLISGAVACAQVKVYLRNGDERERAPEHALDRVLRLRPNRFMTAATFWKFLVASKLLAGNAYANIIRGRGGVPVGLYPHNPRNVEVYYAWELGLDAKLGVERNRLYYHVSFEDGNWRMFDQDDMIHVLNVPGVGSIPGKKGLSTIRAMARGVGLALGAEESAGSLFENGMMSQVALTYPRQFSTEGYARLRDHLRQKYSGASKHHTPLILTEGGDVKTLTMSAEDAQLLESRKFSVIDICRFFGVNPVMVGESEKTSSWGSGVEQMGRWFNTLTMNEHFTAIEQELEVKLFRDDGHFAEFDETELTRGDTQARANFYKVARGSLQEPGFMTINEIRAAEGQPPIAGGDELQRPATNAAKGGNSNA